MGGLCDKKFMSQASSLSFLANQGFDFNKLIKEGIPYLNLLEEEKVKFKLEKRNKFSNVDSKVHCHNDEISEIPPDQKGYVDHIVSKVTTFFESNGNDEEKSPAILEFQCSSLQSELIFSHVRTRYPNLLFVSAKKTCGGCTVTVKKAASSCNLEKESFDKKSLPAAEKPRIEDYVGFSEVVRKITNSGKLVVGHNMLLDLCHILGQFCEPLPEDYEEFKAMTNTFFPRVIDTKVMATTKPFRDLLPNSALGPLLKALLKAPFRNTEIVTAKDFPSYKDDSLKEHEAGYDAFVTGRCLIALTNYLEDISASHKAAVVHESSLITPFYQKIYMMMVTDIPYMTLSGPDLEPSREHIFYVTFPKSWKLHDIFHLFSVHGTVRVDWTGDTSAFVTLHRKENCHFVLSAMNESTLPVGCSVISYETYVNSKHKNVASSQAAEVQEQEPPRKRSGSVMHSNSSALPSPKKSRRDSENPKLNKTQFAVSADWD
ncbi:poly(A)-specific ribonuclease PARN-like isoform X2 [Daphnia pulex]|nr:poly(A)-specific ribonuclease PARN-like isoform X2 [Daphnia pulex]XP_046642081.1 poly(A)-specific ribonuclease PARN-like isoform X2 [Daphnia pulicaria]